MEEFCRKDTSMQLLTRYMHVEGEFTLYYYIYKMYIQDLR